MINICSTKHINMNYQKHYNNLIDRAKNRVLYTYFENHHIIPKCMGGTNHKSNLVKLTPEEHYVAHQLLIKIYPLEKKLIFAAHMMTVGSTRVIRNNKSYGWIRRQWADELSKIAKDRTGEKNGMFERHHTDETKKKISESKKGQTLTDEHKRIISEANKGKVLSDRHKEILSHTHRNKIVSDETRLKMSKSQKGKKRSEEFCNRRSEIVSGDGNPMYGQGHKISGNKNGMYGKSAVKGRCWFCNENNETIYVFPDDEKIITGLWQKGRKWHIHT